MTAIVFLILSISILSSNGLLHKKNKDKGVFDYASSIYSSLIPKVTDYFTKSSNFGLHHKKNHKIEHTDDHQQHIEEHHPKKPHYHATKGHYHRHPEEHHDTGYLSHNLYHLPPAYGNHYNDYQLGGYAQAPPHYQAPVYGNSYGSFGFDHFK